MVNSGSQVGSRKFQVWEPAVPCHGNLWFQRWEPSVPTFSMWGLCRCNSILMTKWSVDARCIRWFHISAFGWLLGAVQGHWLKTLLPAWHEWPLSYECLACFGFEGFQTSLFWFSPVPWLLSWSLSRPAWQEKQNLHPNRGSNGSSLSMCRLGIVRTGTQLSLIPTLSENHRDHRAHVEL